MSGSDATQNGAPPPPPPPPTGSPFGRFLTQPVFLVALLALMISLPVVALSLRGDGGNAAAPPQPAAVGEWEGSAVSPDASGAIDVELTIRSVAGGDDDGTLVRGGCRGMLSHQSTTGRRLTFSYVEQGDPERCPLRSAVTVTPLEGDRLRFVERRHGQVVGEGVLTAR